MLPIRHRPFPPPAAPNYLSSYGITGAVGCRDEAARLRGSQPVAPASDSARRHPCLLPRGGAESELVAESDVPVGAAEDGNRCPRPLQGDRELRQILPGTAGELKQRRKW